MTRVNKFKVNTLNSKFKEVWVYCKTIEDAIAHKLFAIKNGLASSIFEYNNGKWKHV